MEGHQQVHAQGDEDLRGDGIHAVTEEAADLLVSFDPLEEQFDFSAGLVDIGHGLRGPAPVVGQEDIDPAGFRVSVLDPADLRQFGLQRLAAGQADDLVLQNRAVLREQQGLHYLVHYCLAGPGDPENPALGQLLVPCIAAVAAVKDHHATRRESERGGDVHLGLQFPADRGKGRDQAIIIQPQRAA